MPHDALRRYIESVRASAPEARERAEAMQRTLDQLAQLTAKLPDTPAKADAEMAEHHLRLTYGVNQDLQTTKEVLAGMLEAVLALSERVQRLEDAAAQRVDESSD